MKSKFDSKCIRCGLKITAGEDIFYQRGKGAWHTDCAAVKEQVEKEQAARKAEAPYMVTRGSGYSGDSFIKGQVIRAPKNIIEKGGPTYLYVVRTDEQYFKYDGLSFGVGDESGYVYRADCRAATAEEAAPLIERERQATEKRAALNELDKIKKTFRTTASGPMAIMSRRVSGFWTPKPPTAAAIGSLSGRNTSGISKITGAMAMIGA